MPDVWGQIVSLVGVALGSAITLTINQANVRAQQREANQSRLENRAAIRRDACVVFLTAADRFIANAAVLSDGLDTHILGSELERAYGGFLDSWHVFEANNASLQITGPKVLSDAAEALRYAVAVYSTALEQRYRNGRTPKGAQQGFDDMYKAKRAFVTRAQEILDTAT